MSEDYPSWFAFIKVPMPWGGGGGGGGGVLMTFDRLLFPNQGRFALKKVKSSTSLLGGGGGGSHITMIGAW